ncbi:putative transmembrane protein, partial [Toxoplasma gondii GAB2-2007-GAL-DOM2]
LTLKNTKKQIFSTCTRKRPIQEKNEHTNHTIRNATTHCFVPAYACTHVHTTDMHLLCMYILYNIYIYMYMCASTFTCR